MSNRSDWSTMLMVAFAAVIPGAFIVAPSLHSVAASAGSSVTAAADSAVGMRHALSARDLLEQYLGRPLDGLGTGHPVIQAMIVDLPDPVDAPNLDWGYDAGMMSIRRAGEAAGLIVDRFWLPWGPRGDLKKANADSLRRLRANPGVILFRRVEDNPLAGSGEPLVIVFVVGETPNGGINKPAFRSAMVQFRDLRRAGVLADSNTLRLIAPYFTGAAPSLRIALSSVHDFVPIERAVIVTGSATQDGVRAQLTNIFGLPTSFEATVNSDADLQTVAIDAAIDRLGFAAHEIALLEESSTPYGQAYRSGASARRAESSRKASRLRTAGIDVQGFQQAPTADTAVARATGTIDSATTIPFPMHIASMRDQEEAVSAAPVSPAFGQSPAPFPVSLREPGEGVDRPASVSALTPASVDLAIEEISHVLRARHFRAVGIIGTDIRDKLFLAREVRRRLPDVQLFTTENNILYLWPEYNDALRGMLVATTYPLVLETQAWDHPAGILHVFTDEGAEGIFNAVLRQLDAAPEKLVDFGIPQLPGSLRRPPVWLVAVGRDAFVPLLVDSVPTVGIPFALAVRDRAHGAKALGERDLKLPVQQAGGPRGSSSREPREPSPMSLWVMVLLLVAAGLLFGGRVVEAWRAQREYSLIDMPTDAASVGFKRLGSVVRWRSLLLHQQVYTMIRDLTFGTGVVMVAIMLVQATRAETTMPTTGIEWLPACLGIGVAIVVLISVYWALVVIVLTWGYATEYAVKRDWFTERRRGSRADRRAPVLPPAPEPDTERRMGPADRRRAAASRANRKRRLWQLEVALRTGVVIVAGGFALLAAELMRGALNPIGHTYGALATKLFFYRAVHLTSGLSPVLPALVVVLGFGAWTTWHLSRIALLKSPVAFETFAQLDHADSGERVPLSSTLASYAVRIRERLFLIVPEGSTLVVLIVLLLIGWAIFLQFNPTLESLALPAIWHKRTAFDLILSFGVLASLGAIAWGGYRFWLVWLSLKRLLDELSSSPLLPAFERIPERMTHLSQLTLRQSSTREAVTGVAETQWAQLVAIYHAATPDLQALPADLATAVAASVAPGASGERITRPFDLGASDRSAAIDAEVELDERGSADERRRRSEGIDNAKRAREQEVGERFQRLFEAIQQFWRYEPQQPQIDKAIVAIAASKTADDAASTSGSLRRLVSDPARLWLRAAEELVAVQIVAYIEWVLQHLRALAIFLLISVFLGTALLSSYPFQPQSGIKLVFVALLLATVGSIVLVGTQLNRDEVVSRVTRSDPGRITWSAGYIVNLLIFGLLPILGYVGSGVQPIRSALLSWFEPLARLLTQH